MNSWHVRDDIHHDMYYFIRVGTVLLMHSCQSVVQKPQLECVSSPQSLLHKSNKIYNVKHYWVALPSNQIPKSILPLALMIFWAAGANKWKSSLADPCFQLILTEIHTYTFATVFLLDNSICQTAHTFKRAWVGVCLTIRATHWIKVCCYHHGTHTQCLATNHFTLMVWMCTQTRFSTRICEKRHSDNFQNKLENSPTKICMLMG